MNLLRLSWEVIAECLNCHFISTWNDLMDSLSLAAAKTLHIIVCKWPIQFFASILYPLQWSSQFDLLQNKNNRHANMWYLTSNSKVVYRSMNIAKRECTVPKNNTVPKYTRYISTTPVCNNLAIAHSYTMMIQTQVHINTWS